jgi:hypothetical protein
MMRVTDHEASRLLEGEEERHIRPWVWVSLLFFVPLVRALVSQCYTHIAVCGLSLFERSAKRLLVP